MAETITLADLIQRHKEGQSFAPGTVVTCTVDELRDHDLEIINETWEKMQQAIDDHFMQEGRNNETHVG